MQLQKRSYYAAQALKLTFSWSKIKLGAFCNVTSQRHRLQTTLHVQEEIVKRKCPQNGAWHGTRTKEKNFQTQKS